MSVAICFAEEVFAMKVSIRSRNVRLSAADRERVVRRVEFALSQFSDRVRQVSVVLEDENGQRGGVDKKCRVLARVAPLGDVVAEGTGEKFDSAAGTAIDRTAKLISRGLGRISGQKKKRVSMAGDVSAAE
jgi:ribosome-associated translation inhibitor RaiA